MDSLENKATNTQTIGQTAASDDKSSVKDESSKSQAPAAKPDKPKQTYKCLVCGKSYSKKTSLFTHHKTHPDHCVHCGENRGSTVENIYEHNLKHINIRPFVCKVCGDSFARNQQFVEHEKSHLEKKPDDKDTPPVTKEKDNKYKCKTCQLSYTNWKLFYKHQQESGHFNEKFLCEICGSEFLSNFLLSQHIRRLHKRTDETFPCTSCSKVFASKPNLDSHIKKIHQNDNTKMHRCETCNNLFSSAPNLKQHIKTVHEVEREYECQTCKKPFKAKNRLTRHEKEVHMGKNGNPDEARMFNCDHCQKKYKRSWHQARHNQMKHENSNTSTATSSTSTPPTPEINGNLNLPSANNNNNNINNNNFNYQQQQQQPPIQQQQIHPVQPSQISSPSLSSTSSHVQQHPITQDLSNIAPQQSAPTQQQPPHLHHQQQQQNIIPPASQQTLWNQQMPHHHHLAYGNEMIDTKNYGVPPNGEYVHYAVNEQYSNKFDVQVPASAAAAAAPQQVSYDSWNQQQVTSWDYNQQQHLQQQPMYHQPNEWSYYDPNQQQQQQHHGMYNNTYNNYKTDYNCLNQQPQTHLHHQNADPSIYNGGNYYYYADPYANHHQQMSSSAASAPPPTHADYSTNQSQQQQHSNYQNNPM